MPPDYKGLKEKGKYVLLLSPFLCAAPAPASPVKKSESRYYYYKLISFRHMLKTNLIN